MPLHRAPKCALSQSDRMETLRQDRAVEGLRKYLIQYECFPEGRDPKSSPIREEELKELVKHWKLHRQRNFWRENTTKDDLVRVLEAHVQQLHHQNQRRAKYRAELKSTHLESGTSSTGSTAKDGRVGGLLLAPIEDDGRPNSRSAIIDLEGALNHLRMAMPLFGESAEEALASGSDQLPEECLLYMSRVGMVGAGRINPALHRMGSANRRNRRRGESGQLTNGSTDDDGFDHSDDVPEQDDFAIDSGAAADLDEMEGFGSRPNSRPASRPGTSPKKQSIRDKSKAISLRRNLADGLMNVAERAPEAILSQTNAVKTLLDLCRDDDEKVAYMASIALLNLTRDNRQRIHLLRSGALFVLFDLSQHHRLAVRENAALALARMTMDPQSQPQLVVQSAHFVLKEMFKQSNEHIETSCVIGVVNLASVPGTSVSDVIVETLRSLSLNRDERVLDLVCEAVLNLSILACSRANIVDAGAMAVLSNILSHPASSVETRACVANVFANLSSMRVNQADMMREGVVKHILTIMGGALDPKQLTDAANNNNNNNSADDDDYESQSSDVPHAVMQFCVMALTYLASNHRFHYDIIEQGGVHALVKVARTAGISQSTKASISCCLAHLTSTVGCCPLIVSHSALPSLINLLDEENLIIKKDSVTALCNLVVHPETKRATIDSGVITALVGLSRASDITLNQVCALALFNLSCSKEIHDIILQQGGTQAMVTLLGSPSQEVVSNCMKAMSNMSISAQSSEQIIDCEGVPMIVQVAERQDTSVSVRKVIAATLFNLSLIPSGRDRMVEDGAVGCLITLSKIPSKDTKFRAAGALANLCVIQKALQYGLITAMVHLAQTDDIPTQLRVANAFAHLSCKGIARGLMCGEEGMTEVLNSMMRSGHEESQIASASCLVNLSSLTEWNWSKAQLHDFIVIALLRTNSEPTKLLCTKVLFNVLVPDATREAMIGESVLYALMRISRLSCAEIHQICVQAVFNLSCEKDMHAQLHQNQATLMIQSMAKVAQQKSMRQDLANALANLSSEKGHEEELVNEGGLEALKELLKLRDTTAQIALARFLANVTTCHSVLERLVDDTVVLNGLLDFVKSSETELSTLALLSLTNISCNIKTHKRLVESETIEVLLGVLETSSDSTNIQRCVQILRNFLVCNRELTGDLLVHEAVPILVKQLEVTDNEATCRACAKICYVLATHPSKKVVEKVVDGGIMAGLKAMSLQLNDHEAQSEAMIALCNVSRCYSRQKVVMSQGIVEAVVNIGSKGTNNSTAFHFNCAATLRNLTVNQDNIPTLISIAGLVRLLMILAKSDDKATRSHITVALHNICTARDPAGKQAIVRNNGFSMLIELSERGDSMMKTFSGLALQSISGTDPGSDQSHVEITPELSARLVSCMLDIGQVKDSEQYTIVEPTVTQTGSITMDAGRTHCQWDAHPTPLWPVQTCPSCELPDLDVVDLLALPPSRERSRGNKAKMENDALDDVEKPRARKVPHDEADLIMGHFTVMHAHSDLVEPDHDLLNVLTTGKRRSLQAVAHAASSSILPPINRK